MTTFYKKVEHLLINPKADKEWRGRNHKSYIVTTSYLPKHPLQCFDNGTLKVYYDDKEAYELCFSCVEPLPFTVGRDFQNINELEMAEYICRYMNAHSIGNSEEDENQYIQRTVICKSTNQRDVEEFDKTCTELVNQGYRTIDLCVVDGKLARVFYLADGERAIRKYIS